MFIIAVRLICPLAFLTESVFYCQRKDVGRKSYNFCLFMNVMNYVFNGKHEWKEFCPPAASPGTESEAFISSLAYWAERIFRYQIRNKRTRRVCSGTNKASAAGPPALKCIKKKKSITRRCLAHSSPTLAIDLLSPFHLAGITILLHKHQKNPEGSSLRWNQYQQ